MLEGKRIATEVRKQVEPYEASDFRRMVFGGLSLGYFEVYEDRLILSFLDALKNAERDIDPVRSRFDSLRFDFVDVEQESLELYFSPQGARARFGDAFYELLKKLETFQAERLRNVIKGCRDDVQCILVTNLVTTSLPKEANEAVITCLARADERFCAFTRTQPGFGVPIQLNLVNGESISFDLVFPSPHVENIESILPQAFWDVAPSIHALIKKYADG